MLFFPNNKFLDFSNENEYYKNLKKKYIDMMILRSKEQYSAGDLRNDYQMYIVTIYYLMRF